MALISVALPVWRAASTLGDAIGCILAQTHRELELLLVLNGSDGATTAVAREAAARDGRVRVLTRAEASLPAALNMALREARGEFVARMDADDACPPERLARQAAFLAEHRGIAALGSAWEIEEAGRVTATIRPPRDPADARWRLLIENPFAHGSMMLRRSSVIAAGGYDESLVRAQDYDLWLRLSRVAGVCALPDVLYTHRRADTGAYSASPLQAQHAAAIMTRAWSELPAGPAPTGALAQALGTSDGRAEALGTIERALAESPSREALIAWLWVNTMLPASRGVLEVCRAARVREVAARVAGTRDVWLWGAGSHCPIVLDLLRTTPLTVVGLIDDHLAGQERHGFLVSTPAALRPGDHAILASDAHEDALWKASASVRSRGVHVHRLYAD